MIISREPQARRSVVKRFAGLAAKLAVSGGIAWYLLSRIDLAQSADRLAALAPGWGVPALAVLALMLVVAAARWRVFASALSIGLPFSAALRLSLIGQFFGQALPGGVGGDAVRVWLLVRRGVRVGPSVSSVLLDRLAGLGTLLILIAIALPALFSFADDGHARLGVVLVLVAGGAGFGVLVGLSYVPHFATRWPRMRALAEEIARARRASFAPRTVISALLLSLVVHLLLLLSIFLLARALGLDLTPLACFALVPPVILLSALPISIAGWGVREGAMVAALGFAGIQAGDALALSVLFGIATLLVSLSGSVVWLAQGREARRKTATALAEDGRTEIAA